MSLPTKLRELQFTYGNPGSLDNVLVKYSAVKDIEAVAALAADRIEDLESALKFYRDAWVEDFGFLGGEPTEDSPVPSDALTEDRGARARAALA